jgi:predicted ABC-type ATPase
MAIKTLYIIAGPNGAGKTTASYTILPEIFNCGEFVNADEIARGISPFNPEKVGVKAGRIMLQRIHELLGNEESFAFETTLSTKSYVGLIKKAQHQKYEVILLFLALDSKELALRRVKTRVKEGGHNIPKDIIERRFQSGLQNLFDLYIPIVNKWVLIDNSGTRFEFIAEGSKNKTTIKNEGKWSLLKKISHGN